MDWIRSFKVFFPLLKYLPFGNSGSKNMHHQKKVSIRYVEAKRFPQNNGFEFLILYSDMQITRQSYLVPKFFSCAGLIPLKGKKLPTTYLLTLLCMKISKTLSVLQKKLSKVKTSNKFSDPSVENTKTINMLFKTHNGQKRIKWPAFNFRSIFISSFEEKCERLTKT